MTSRKFKSLLKKLKQEAIDNIEKQKELNDYIDYIDYEIDELDITIKEPEELDIFKFKGQHNYEYVFNFNLEEALSKNRDRINSLNEINKNIDVNIEKNRE